jgi:hypothetical protein
LTLATIPATASSTRLEKLDGTVWWTHRLNEEKNKHNDSYQNIITAESNQVHPGQLPQ